MPPHPPLPTALRHHHLQEATSLLTNAPHQNRKPPRRVAPPRPSHLLTCTSSNMHASAPSAKSRLETRLISKPTTASEPPLLPNTNSMNSSLTASTRHEPSNRPSRNASSAPSSLPPIPLQLPPPLPRTRPRRFSRVCPHRAPPPPHRPPPLPQRLPAPPPPLQPHLPPGSHPPRAPTITRTPFPTPR